MQREHIRRGFSIYVSSPPDLSQDTVADTGARLY